MENTFKLKVNGKPKTVKMTMGLLHEVASTITFLELMPEAIYNPEIRADLLVTLLSPRDEDGEITETIKVKTLDADPTEIINLLEWAVGHAADFLLKSIQSGRKVWEGKEALVKSLMPTSDGGEA